MVNQEGCHLVHPLPDSELCGKGWFHLQPDQEPDELKLDQISISAESWYKLSPECGTKVTQLCSLAWHLVKAKDVSMWVSFAYDNSQTENIMFVSD
jgi:hypothetical protein